MIFELSESEQVVTVCNSIYIIHVMTHVNMKNAAFILNIEVEKPKGGIEGYSLTDLLDIDIQFSSKHRIGLNFSGKVDLSNIQYLEDFIGVFKEEEECSDITSKKSVDIITEFVELFISNLTALRTYCTERVLHNINTICPRTYIELYDKSVRFDNDYSNAIKLMSKMTHTTLLTDGGVLLIVDYVKILNELINNQSVKIKYKPKDFIDISVYTTSRFFQKDTTPTSFSLKCNIIIKDLKVENNNNIEMLKIIISLGLWEDFLKTIKVHIIRDNL